MKTKTSFKKGHKPTYTAKGKEHHQFKHGMYGTRIYKKWEAMKRRCLNKNESHYKYYGGRGIKICDKWLAFEGFYEDMHKTFKDGLSLERIDNNKGYIKENCKWIPLNQQARNKQNVKLHLFKGEMLTLGEIEKKMGYTEGLLRARIEEYGWSIEKALSVPPLKGKGYFLDNRGLYRVEVKRKGQKKKFVGRYKTEKEAIKAREDFLHSILCKK